jgi:BON domain
MDPNRETVQKRVIVNSPGQRSEVLSERTETVPRESGPSTGTIAIIAVLAIAVVAAIFFVISNRNANEAANRNANVALANQVPPATTIQQPAAQPAPVIIQQPVASQPAPVIIQQPALPSQRELTSANEDATMQDVATKKLTEDVDMAGVVMTISDARAVLTGTVRSPAAKAKAEQIVKGVRGVKSVDNQILVSA